MEPIKEIPGYGGRYWAVESGVILTTIRGELTPLKTSKNDKGYPVVYFSHAGRTVKKTVHRLVADMFVKGKTRARNEVEHLDNDRQNPAAYNLEWVTRAENMRRMWARKRERECANYT